MSAVAVTFATFGVYMALLLVIGWQAERRFGASYGGFISADRSLGAWVSGISAAASSESSWLMLGLSGLGYRHGLGAYWAAGGCSFGFVMTAIFVVRQLRRSASRYSVLTLGDYFVSRLSRDGRGGTALRLLSSALIAVFLLVYVVAQFTGAGKQLAGMGLLEYRGGVLLGGAIVGLYVLVGGYAAVCWTDFVQGLLMVAVLLILPFAVLVQAGGLQPVMQALQQSGTDSIWVGGAGPSRAALGFAATYFGFALGYPGMPHAIIRYVTIRDEEEARRAAIISAIYGTLVLFGSATLGVFGRAVLTDLTDPEKVLPAFTASFFPPVLAGIILAAVTAAIMSTADSQLLMAASALVHDVWSRVLRRGESVGREMTLQTRAVLAALTIVALMLALAQPRVIDTLVLFAWGCLGAGFSPVVLLCLYWPRFAWQGAVACMVVGPSTTILWQLTGMSESLHGLIPGTALGLVAAVAVSSVVSRSSNDGGGERRSSS